MSTTSGRIHARFAALKQQKHAALVTYVMAHDPDRATSLALLHTLVQSGADMLEVGIPFSDPMADGKIIQASGIRALKQGATVRTILELVREFRTTDAHTPVILMGYYNPIYHYGATAFARDAHQAGVDGIILVDLPPEEEHECVPELKSQQITPVRLIAPTSLDGRLPLLLEQADGFVYYISVLGVTGTKSAKQASLSEDLAKLRAATQLPICVGFGIKTPEQAESIASLADGVVIGSALVDAIAKASSPDQALTAAASLVSQFSNAVKRAKKL